MQSKFAFTQAVKQELEDINKNLTKARNHDGHFFNNDSQKLLYAQIVAMVAYKEALEARYAALKQSEIGTPSKKPSLKAPTLLLSFEENNLKAEGVADPKAKVTIKVKANDKDSETLTADADNEGAYTVKGKEYTNGEKIEASAVQALDGQTSEATVEHILAPVVKPKHTVTFETNGGSAFKPTEVEDGKTVPKPTNPTKSGYKFIGWFSDAAFKKKYDFSTPVTSDITIYAKWEEITFTVTFDSKGGSKVNPQTVKSREKATKPADPTLADNTFGGWFSYDNLTKEFDFNSVITSNVTLHAKWTPTAE